MSCRITALTLCALSAAPALSQGLVDRFGDDGSGCYSRSYSASHLARHPEQQVTAISLRPEALVADGAVEVWLSVTLRAWPDEALVALAYCAAAGADRFNCTLEGDAGGFAITPAKDNSLLVQVLAAGIGLEGAKGFVTLEQARGDDRSFLLHPSRTCN